MLDENFLYKVLPWGYYILLLKAYKEKEREERNNQSDDSLDSDKENIHPNMNPVDKFVQEQYVRDPDLPKQKNKPGVQTAFTSKQKPVLVAEKVTDRKRKNVSASVSNGRKKTVRKTGKTKKDSIEVTETRGKIKNM